jgi:hypothetical protein
MEDQMKYGIYIMFIKKQMVVGIRQFCMLDQIMNISDRECFYIDILYFIIKNGGENKMKIYNVYQSGKRLYIDEKENPDNKIVVNKYDNMQQTLRLISDGTLPPRLYWALRNPKLSNKYFILKLVNNEDLIVGTDISAYAGLWDMLLIGTDEDYIIEGTDIDQSRLTYVSDHFGRLFVRDNFLEELDFEEQCSPTFKIFYDEIIFQLGNKADSADIPDKMSDLENDTNFISGVALKDDGNGHVEIIGTTFSGGETEEGEIPSGGSVEVDDKLDEKSTNPVQNQVITKEVKSLKEKDESLDKEVIALRERNAELEETIEKLQIKVTTDKAPFHHITDSTNMKVLDFGMEGKTEQETTPGNQLIDNSGIESATVEGVTFMVKEDGSIVANGTTGENIAIFYVGTVKLDSSKEYILSGCGGTGSTSTYSIRINNNVTSYDDVGKGITFNGGNDGEFKPFIFIRANQTVSNVVFKPMLRLSSVADDTYEPFANGPTPNPDFPQEIVNAGVTKNLFDVEKAKDESNYIWGSIYPYFPVYVGAGNTITFSCNLSNATNYPRTVTIFDAVDGNNLSYIWHNENTTLQKDEVTITSPNDYIYIRLGCLQTETLLWLDFITDIQIELGSVATEYEPFGYKIGCEVAGKNLFDVEKAKDESNYLRDEGTIQYYFFPVYIGAGNTFTFSWKLPTGNDLPDYTVIIYDGVGTKVLSYVWYKENTVNTKETVTLVSPNDYIYIRINRGELPSWWDDFTDIQIELGSVATEYEPYKEYCPPKFTLTSPVPLTKWDYLTKRDGVWGWSVWSFDIALYGHSGWVAYAGRKGFCCNKILPFYDKARECFCNVLRSGNSATLPNVITLGIDNNSIYCTNVSLYDSELEDSGLSNWKAYLNENQLEIWTYSDTEQAFYPLPDEEQILLNNIETYYGVTNMYNDQGCPMWLTYVADPKLYVDQKLEQINNALLSLGANV